MEISTKVLLKGEFVDAEKREGKWWLKLINPSTSVCDTNRLSPQQAKAFAKEIQDNLEQIKKIETEKMVLGMGEAWYTATFSSCLHEERVSVTIPRRFLGTRTINVCKQCGQYE